MLNDAAKKWVAALRSGEYRQGKGALVTEDGKYCCLGVACHLYEMEGVQPPIAYRGRNFLPDAVCEWLGTACISLVALLNDGQGIPFPEIADIIESEPEGLFVPQVKE